MSKEFQFLMGADPEFVLIAQNKQISAASVMSTLKPKDGRLIKAGNDWVVTVDGKKAGSFGQDGRASTGELRPSASNSPAGLADNIGHLIAEIKNNTKFIKATTLSIFDPIGGHIHFGLPQNILDNQNETLKIHKTIASFFLPLMMTENKVSLHMRVQTSYGKINDYRNNSAGSSKPQTYEFRAPTSEWITTRKIAECTLAYLGVVMNEILNHPENMKKFENIIYKTDRQGQALQLLMMTNFQHITKSLVREIKSAVRTFALYKEFKNEIEYITDTERVIRDKKAAKYDMFVGWGLTKEKKIKPETFISEEALKKHLLKKDIEVYSELTNIPYNSDLNVEEFAKALSKRITAYEITTKFNYHLFGLRKGVKDYIVTNFKRPISFLAGESVIKTKDDRAAMIMVFERMQAKFEENINIETEELFDIEDGKIKKTYEKNIIIGIPYEDRVNLNIEKFLRKIVEIEKKDEKDYTTLDSLPDKKDGEIAKVYIKGPEGEKMPKAEKAQIKLNIPTEEL